MSQVIALSIVRFNEIIKDSCAEFQIDESTSFESIKDELYRYLNAHKSIIVFDCEHNDVIEGKDQFFTDCRKAAFHHWFAEIKYSASLKSMNKYFQIPDGFDDKMEPAVSFVRVLVSPTAVAQ